SDARAVRLAASRARSIERGATSRSRTGFVSHIEVKVPDIGDFKDVPVIEVFVKPGDTVKKEDSLVTLESDKATMDVPSPAAGTVKELKLKVGDKVSEGTVILTLDSEGAGTQKPAAATAPKAAPISPPPSSPPAKETSAAPAPGASTYSGKADI